MVKKRTLFAIASIVWMIAGINVLKIGFECYVDNFSIINMIGSIIIFGLFDYFVFGKLVKKHHQRILKLEGDKHYFYQFFDLKSFIIMAFMISFGIIIRVNALLSIRLIAIFYTGLGTALTLAGLRFGYLFIKY